MSEPHRLERKSGRLLRPLAFFRKDVIEVLRQPRLLLTLILGPFLILLIFGLGFATEPSTLRTVLVTPPGEEIADSEALAERISHRVELVATLEDETAARDMLTEGEVDLVVVIPPGATDTIAANQQAELTVYHDQIDPFERSLVEIFAHSSVDALNEELFKTAIEAGQAEAVDLAGSGGQPWAELSPEVVVNPFVADIGNNQGIAVDFSHYYVPGVVVLLLQHLALTFAALSLVRERSLGTVELFRVSPLTGGETLIGKYLAYTLLGALVGAALTAAATYGFGFQMPGSWWWYAAVCLLVLLAAQGAGFVVSAMARTETEAVQYSMIMLLVAIFFSGFFLPLDRFLPAARVISYLIPATYGIVGLQDVAFRGVVPSPETILGLAGLALSLVVASWVLIRLRVVAARD
jgi:ABC-2 type transport system permease protein